MGPGIGCWSPYSRGKKIFRLAGLRRTNEAFRWKRYRLLQNALFLDQMLQTPVLERLR
jgi:hypothetical protein